MKRLNMRRGQVVVFYALMVPIFLLVCGVGLDLGWYYLNVSRLQNAADAAVLAGAKKIERESTDTFGVHYYTKDLISRVPVGDWGVFDYEDIDTNKDKIAGSEKYKTAAEIKETMIAGRNEVERYTRLNTADDTDVSSPDKSTRRISAVNGWSTAVEVDNKKIKGYVNIYAEVSDLRNDIYGPMYYQVVLEEKISHFFLRNFKPMEAVVVAVALLEPHDTDLLSAMHALEDTMVLKNWETQNELRKAGYDLPYVGKWNHFQRADKKIHYTNGDVVKREDFEVNSNLYGKTTARSTEANGGNVYKDSELDSINIDYKQDLNMGRTGFTEDWDLGVEELPSPVTKITAVSTDGNWNENKAFDLRIHSNVDFNAPWETRYPQKSKPDVLWCRIESDPYYWNIGANLTKTMTQLNSVRQIFLNFNNSNAGRYPEGSTEGVPGAYKYRPLCIFYMGPEKIEKDDTVKRVSQPLVLNFNTDYNAIIFAPNSPVVINGNGHTFKGFVIAKEFVKATEESDYKNFEEKDAYFELNDLKFTFKTDTLPANATAVSIGHIDDDVKYYVDSNAYITSIAASETVPVNKVQVDFAGSDLQHKYYVDADKIKCAKRLFKKNGSEVDSIPTGSAEINLTDDSKSKLKGYITEDKHYYKIVEKSTFSCGSRDSTLVYDTDAHGDTKHENTFFVNWKGNLQTKPMIDPLDDEKPYRVKDNDESIEDSALIANPDVEVVYYSSAFGLSDDSRYSSFEVESLVRKVYSYLDSGDSVDMFFTAERAGWVD